MFKCSKKIKKCSKNVSKNCLFWTCKQANNVIKTLKGSVPHVSMQVNCIGQVGGFSSKP